MKRRWFCEGMINRITLLLFIGVAWGQAKMDINNLIDRAGIIYKKNDDKPYTGNVFDFYANGQKKFNGKYKNGLKNGKWTWLKDGRVDSTGNYKNGKKDGEWIEFNDNREVEIKGTYINGKKDGEWIEFNDNREVEIKGTYINGKKDGLWTWVLDYGKKEIIYKNSEIKNIFLDGNEIWIPKYLDRKIPKSECISLDSTGIVYVSDLYTFIWENNGNPSIVFANIIENLINAGAWIIIFDSKIPALPSYEWGSSRGLMNEFRLPPELGGDYIRYMPSVKVREEYKDKIFWALGYEDLVKRIGEQIDILNLCSEEIINLQSSPPIYGIEQIIDTQRYQLNIDIDWMSQFLPSDLPEWIMAIEDDTERNEMISMLELKDIGLFDITQSPFYEKIVIIRP